jgi:hypothetical protein
MISKLVTVGRDLEEKSLKHSIDVTSALVGWERRSLKYFLLALFFVKVEIMPPVHYATS